MARSSWSVYLKKRCVHVTCSLHARAYLPATMRFMLHAHATHARYMLIYALTTRHTLTYTLTYARVTRSCTRSLHATHLRTRSRTVPSALWQGIKSYKTDPVWLSWLALVAFESAAAADAFVFPEGADNLDQLFRKHFEAFRAVPQYTDCWKPKHYLRANYAADIASMGPPIRSSCLSFEALIQVLKRIAKHSNFKCVNKRIAHVWAIRHGLMLHDDALSSWSDAVINFTNEPLPVTVCDNGANMATRKGKLLEFEQAVRVYPHVTRARPHARYMHAATSALRISSLRSCYKRVTIVLYKRVTIVLRAHYGPATRAVATRAIGSLECVTCVWLWHSLYMCTRTGMQHGAAEHGQRRNLQRYARGCIYIIN